MKYASTSELLEKKQPASLDINCGRANHFDQEFKISEAEAEPYLLSISEAEAELELLSQ